MSDLRLLAFVLSGGFLFLGGIWLGGDYGLALLLLGLVVLLVPVVLACISLIRWLVPPSQDLQSSPMVEMSSYETNRSHCNPIFACSIRIFCLRARSPQRSNA